MKACSEIRGNEIGESVVVDQLTELDRCINDLIKGIVDMQENLTAPQNGVSQGENACERVYNADTLSGKLDSLIKKTKLANEDLAINNKILNKYLGNLRLE